MKKAASVIVTAFGCLVLGLAPAWAQEVEILCNTGEGIRVIEPLGSDGDSLRAPDAPARVASAFEEPLDTQASSLADYSVSLGVTAHLESQLGVPLTSVSAGQVVVLVAEFNQLDTLGIPESELVGKTVTATWIVTGAFFRRVIFPLEITENLTALASLGSELRIPFRAEPGTFAVKAIVSIEGVECLDNLDQQSYEIQ